MGKRKEEIKLRKADLRDAGFLRELFNTPIIMEVLGLSPSTSSRWINALNRWIKDKRTDPFVIETPYEPIRRQGVLVIKEDLHDPEKIWLDLIAFSPNFWGKGEASSALEILFRICSKNGKRKILLKVNRDNCWAQKFFQKNGFFVGGEIYETFGDRGEQKIRLIMEKGLIALEKRQTPERSN